MGFSYMCHSYKEKIEFRTVKIQGINYGFSQLVNDTVEIY